MVKVYSHQNLQIRKHFSLFKIFIGVQLLALLFIILWMTTTLKSMTASDEETDITATVIGMATGYPLTVFQEFVGSLRKSGYNGHIILGVSPNLDSNISRYLQARNVVMKEIKYIECSPDVTATMEGCAHPYPNIKTRWSRFPLARDWLQECSTCTGPVLITDVRDAYFQANPFGPDVPTVKGLQVFEENPLQTTQHWLVEWPIRECKNMTFDKPMLCSGSTIGTREAMLKYLDRMYEEMKLWVQDKKCHFGINGDDQSMHNYLFYSGYLPYAQAIPPRTGIVNTVGVDGMKVFEKHIEKLVKQGRTRGDASTSPYDGATSKTWIGSDVDSLPYALTDSEGYFVNQDGTRSCMIHQYDRFGPNLDNWLRKQEFMQDRLDLE